MYTKRSVEAGGPVVTKHIWKVAYGLLSLANREDGLARPPDAPACKRRGRFATLGSLARLLLLPSSCGEKP